jgi:hypothetical protein
MLNSHKHCQVALAQAQAKTWQRVCLFQCTPKAAKEEARCPNSVLPQLAVTCKIEAECSYQTFVQVDSEVLRYRQLRQHANRCV